MKYFVVVAVQLWTASSVPIPSSPDIVTLVGNVDVDAKQESQYLKEIHDNLQNIVESVRGDLISNKRKQLEEDFGRTLHVITEEANTLTKLVKREIEESENSETNQKVHDILQRAVELRVTGNDEKDQKFEEDFKKSWNIIVEEAGKLSKLVKTEFEESKNSETQKKINDIVQKAVESIQEELKSAENDEKNKKFEEDFKKSWNVIVQEAGKLSELVESEIKETENSETMKNIHGNLQRVAASLQEELEDAVQDAINQKQAE